MVTGLLFLLPALVLAGLLACGRYPGERAVSRLVRRRGRSARAPRTLGRLRRRVVILVGRAAPLACSLAGRAPPVVAR
jgi:hypothetical protein